MADLAEIFQNAQLSDPLSRLVELYKRKVSPVVNGGLEGLEPTYGPGAFTAPSGEALMQESLDPRNLSPIPLSVPKNPTEWAMAALQVAPLVAGVGMAGKSLVKGTKKIPNPERAAIEKQVYDLQTISHPPGQFAPMDPANPVGSLDYWIANHGEALGFGAGEGYPRRAPIDGPGTPGTRLMVQPPLTKVLFDKGINMPAEISVPNEHVPVFKSNLLEAFENPKFPEKMSRDQALAILKSPGVKNEEIKWLGIEDFLKSKEKFSKKEIQDWIRENEIDVEEVKLQESPTFGEWLKKERNLDGAEAWDELPDPQRESLSREYDSLYPNGANTGTPPKYQTYTLPGGENYREVLLKWGNQRKATEPYEQWAQREFPETYAQTPNDSLLREQWVAEVKQGNTTSFTAGHFNEHPNILAHIRLKDRTTPDGKKVLFVEEVQSDWQKKLRTMDKEGADPTTSWDYKASQILHEKGLGGYAPLGKDELAKTRVNYTAKRNPEVPDAPLARNYPELAMKRILRMAAEGGYDAVGWTTGEQQAKRYNQAFLDQVDKLDYDLTKQQLVAYKGGQEVKSFDVPVGKLAEYVGQDTAEKLLTNLSASEGSLTDSIHAYPTNAPKAMLVPVTMADGRPAWVWENPRTERPLVVNEDNTPRFFYDREEAINARPRDRIYMDEGYKILPGINPRPGAKASLEVKNLPVGERGYADVYDRQLRQTADKLGKQFGARTQEGKVHVGDKDTEVGFPDLAPHIGREQGEVFGQMIRHGGTPGQALLDLLETRRITPLQYDQMRQLMKKAGEGALRTADVHLLPLTPTLSKRAKTQSYPLYNILPPTGLGLLAAREWLDTKKKKKQDPFSSNLNDLVNLSKRK